MTLFCNLFMEPRTYHRQRQQE